MCPHAKLNFEESYLNPFTVQLLGENQELKELWSFFQLKCRLQLPADRHRGGWWTTLIQGCSAVLSNQPEKITAGHYKGAHTLTRNTRPWITRKQTLASLLGFLSLSPHLPKKILTMLNVSWSRSSSSSSPMGIGSLPAVMWTGPCDLFPLLPDLASPPLGFTRTNYTHHMMSQTAGSQVIQLTTSALLLLAVVKPRAMLLQLSSQDPLKLFSCNASI